MNPWIERESLRSSWCQPSSRREWKSSRRFATSCKIRIRASCFPSAVFFMVTSEEYGVCGRPIQVARSSFISGVTGVHWSPSQREPMGFREVKQLESESQEPLNLIRSDSAVRAKRRSLRLTGGILLIASSARLQRASCPWVPCPTVPVK